MSIKIASLIAEIGADTSGVEKGLLKTKQELDDYARKYGASSKAITQQNQIILASVLAAASGVGMAIKGVLDYQIEYANNVRTLAAVGNTGTESASRFIQVLDDYKISAEEATQASRFLKNNGLVPNIETLAKLSDQYLAIQDPVKRLDFAQQNLGRSSTKWVEVLGKGSAALLAQNSAVAKNLILTQKMVDDARRAELATDQWSDAVNGLKTTFANELLPVGTKVLNHFNDVVSSFQEQGYWYTLLHQFNLKDVADRREQATALMLAKGAMDENTQSAEDNARAMQAVSDINTGMLGLIGDIEGATKNYNDTNKKLADERLTIASWDVDALNENTRKLQENRDEFLRANAEILSGLVERKLMQDGVLDDKEFEWLVQKRVEWGIYSEESAAAARKVWAEADHITASIANIPSNKTVTITVQQLGGYNIGTQQYGNIAHPGRASGGPVMAGQTYMVGERGPEPFTPSQNGTITSNNNIIDYKKMARAIREALAQAG